MFGLIFIALLVYFIWRGNKVVEYRQDLIRRTAVAIERDRENSIYDSLWRWQMFEAVSIDVMTFMFWRDVDSFYGDLRFTEPTKVKATRKRKVD